MPYAIKLLTALLLTEAIEVPVCMAFGIRKKQLLIVLLANLITNPLLNVIYGLFVLYAPAYSAAGRGARARKSRASAPPTSSTKGSTKIRSPRR